ncbi:Fc.00g116150.m01.CDS01 [Cosmosporella sp. VM-42]
MPGEEIASDSQRHEADPRAQNVSKKAKTLPPWLDHFNAHDLKVLLRCWIAAWVATLLIFINPSLHSIGQATFFAALLLHIIPPASILFVYLLASLSLLFGMCLAWAWGLLTMKAAMAARSDSEIQARIQALEQQASAVAEQSGQSVAWEAQILVHDGFLLDVRVTIVFYVMGCAFIYALARLRCSNPKLVLMQIFGTIVTDIFLLFGPTLPEFAANVAEILVKPGAIGTGLGVACCLLFFPQSTSYMVLSQQEKLIRMGEVALGTTRKRLADQTVQLDGLKAAKGRIIALYKATEPTLAFLPLDLSRGRWSADDVRGLHAPIREVMLASLSLLDFHIARISALQNKEQWETQRDAEDLINGVEKGDQKIGRHHRLQTAHLLNALKSPEQGEMRIRAKEKLSVITSDILQVSSRSIELAARVINTFNTGRWFGKPSQEKINGLVQELQDTMATLGAARLTCATNTTEAILESHAYLFDENGDLKKLEGSSRLPSLPGIVVSMVIEERILGTAAALENLLQHIFRLTQTRTVHRIWLPSRLDYALSWLLNGRASITVSGTSPDSTEDPDLTIDPNTSQEQVIEGRRRLRVSRGYDGSSARRNPWSHAIISTFNWLTNPSGMYALRMVAVTIVTAVPSAIPHSAGFFYREKGIWGVITAQTCLLVYMADFTFSVVSRGLGTVIGGVMGMLAWYIGSGDGPGNPYGMGASTAVMTLILIWWRIFLPPAFAAATIMSGATFALVVGFSYDHHHIIQYGLPGQGYEAFWKRLVTVLLGFVAAFIIQVFPTPPSATHHVCKTLANAVGTLSDHYALLLSHWGRSDQNSPLGAVAEQIALEVAEALLSLNGPIALLKGELSFGPFDQAVLRKTQEQCQYMNQSLGRLLSLSASLPKELQDRLAGTVGILDDRTIGEVMAVLDIIEQALRTGSPLPERLPTPLVRRFVDSYHTQDNALLNTTLVRDESHRRYCVAVSSYLKFLSTIDDLVLILKAALGESHIIHQWEDV